MKTFVRIIVVSFAAIFIVLGFTYCGGDDSADTCPGITCNNCSASGDCSISCAAGQTEFCIAHPDNSDLRCAYCADADSG